MSKVFIKQLMSCLIIGVSYLGLSSSVFALPLTCESLLGRTLIGTSNYPNYMEEVTITISNVTKVPPSDDYDLDGTMEIIGAYNQEFSLDPDDSGCSLATGGIDLNIVTNFYDTKPVNFITLSNPNTLRNREVIALSGDMSITKNNGTVYAPLAANFIQVPF